MMCIQTHRTPVGQDGNCGKNRLRATILYAESWLCYKRKPAGVRWFCIRVQNATPPLRLCSNSGGVAGRPNQGVKGVKERRKRKREISMWTHCSNEGRATAGQVEGRPSIFGAHARLHGCGANAAPRLQAFN